MVICLSVFIRPGTDHDLSRVYPAFSPMLAGKGSSLLQPLNRRWMDSYFPDESFGLNIFETWNVNLSVSKALWVNCIVGYKKLVTVNTKRDKHFIVHV